LGGRNGTHEEKLSRRSNGDTETSAREAGCRDAGRLAGTAGARPGNRLVRAASVSSFLRYSVLKALANLPAAASTMFEAPRPATG